MAAYVKLAFGDSVAATFRAFETGFFKVCSVKVVDLFQPEELRLLMVGRADYDWERFKQVGGGARRDWRSDAAWSRSALIASNVLLSSGDVPFQNTVYDGEYHADHPNIVTFWQVFAKLAEEEKQKFYCK